MMEIEYTPLPTSQEVDFLTQRLNESAPGYGPASSFGFFVRDTEKNIIAGANGTILFGTIYTDQLWVHADYRRQGWGRKIMEKVHDHGKSLGCQMATILTMDIQHAVGFYQKLGYEVDFERRGYAKDSSCLFLRKAL